MSVRFAIALLAILLSAVAPAAPPASAQSQNGRQQMSLESAVQRVQQQTNGRILAADSIQNGRNKLYRIKVLTPEGHVRVMQLHSNDTPGNKSSRDKKRDDSGH